MKLSEWARQRGVSYRTAWNWYRTGRLPVPAVQLPTGTILVEAPNDPSMGAVLYARVSSADQAADLDRQVARLAEFAAVKGLTVTRVVRETGSGLNGHRPRLKALLADADA